MHDEKKAKAFYLMVSTDIYSKMVREIRKFQFGPDFEGIISEGLTEGEKATIKMQAIWSELVYLSTIYETVLLEGTTPLTGNRKDLCDAMAAAKSAQVKKAREKALASIEAERRQNKASEQGVLAFPTKKDDETVH